MCSIINLRLKHLNIKELVLFLKKPKNNELFNTDGIEKSSGKVLFVIHNAFK